MKIGIIGAGSVGQTLAAKLIANGHDVQSRMKQVLEWAAEFTPKERLICVGD